jgi:hypothetical protein
MVGWPVKRVVRTARRCRTIEIRASTLSPSETASRSTWRGNLIKARLHVA